MTDEEMLCHDEKPHVWGEWHWIRDFLDQSLKRRFCEECGWQEETWVDFSKAHTDVP